MSTLTWLILFVKYTFLLWEHLNIYNPTSRRMFLRDAIIKGVVTRGGTIILSLEQITSSVTLLMSPRHRHALA